MPGGGGGGGAGVLGGEAEPDAAALEAARRARDAALEELRVLEEENARLRLDVLGRQLHRREQLQAAAEAAVHRRRVSELPAAAVPGTGTGLAADPAAPTPEEEAEWRAEDQAEVRRRVHQELLHDETASYLAAANAHSRDRARAAVLGHAAVFEQVSALGADRRCQVRHLAGTELVAAAQARDKHPDGRPLSLGRKLRALAEDWEGRGEHAVDAALNLSRAAFAEAQAEADESGVLKEALDGMGFVWRDEPYAFDDPDSAANVVLAPDQDGAGEDGGPAPLRAATLDKVIERITHEHWTDLTARYVLLLTYRSYTDPGTLLRKLADRFNAPVPDNLTPAEVRMFKAQKLDRIQIRVCGVLKYWLQEHYHDFRESEALRGQLRGVLDGMLQSCSSALVARLAAAVRSQLERQGGRRAGAAGPPQNAPRPDISSKISGGGVFGLPDLSPLEVARQLTLLNFEAFRRIQPRELLNQGWVKPDRDTRSPNVHAMTQQFERTAGWVQYAVLVPDSTPAQRAATYRRFVEVAQHCRALNNYHSLYAVLCGLGSSPVHRLQLTKSELPSRVADLEAELRDVFGGRNNRNLREALRRSLTPCIPHLGTFLGDLTFIDLGNKDRVGPGGLVNLFKCRKVADQIRGIQQYQQEAYRLRRVERILDFLGKQLRLPDEDELYALSLRLEPRAGAQPPA